MGFSGSRFSDIPKNWIPILGILGFLFENLFENVLGNIIQTKWDYCVSSDSLRLKFWDFLEPEICY